MKMTMGVLSALGLTLFLLAIAPSNSLVGQARISLADLDQRLTVVEAKRSPLQIATLRWFEARAASSIQVPAFPKGLHFDGQRIWTVGSAIATGVWPHTPMIDYAITTADDSQQVLHDGLHLWVTNFGSQNIMRYDFIRNERTTTIFSRPTALAFDGTYVWVTSFSTGSLARWNASDMSFAGLLNAGVVGARAALFDGTNLWVTGGSDTTGTLAKIRPSDGARLATYPIGADPRSMTFDGTYIWVGHYNGKAVSRIRASDGTVGGTTAIGNFVTAVLYDGSAVWVTSTQTASNVSPGSVQKLNLQTGAVAATLPNTILGPSAMAFDGLNIWVSAVKDSTGAGLLYKL